MDPVKIGRRLKELRGVWLTQAKLAEEIGTTPAAISNYEQGIRIPSDEHKIKLANYFGVTVQELFFD